MKSPQVSSLSHREAQALFQARVDTDLDGPSEGQLRAHLDGCAECRQGWERYAHAVATVQAVPRARAPVSLATLVARRVRKKRLSPRAFLRSHAEYRLPVEIVLPLILGVVIAALILLMAP